MFNFTIMKADNEHIVKKAKALGINLTVDPALDKKYAGKVIAPEKLEQAKKVISRLRILGK